MPDGYGEKMGQKKSAIARKALKKFVEENLGGKQGGTPFQKIGHLLGSAESGIKNLGQHHREYLSRKIRKGT